MRLVFMGTPDFSVETLKAIHEAGHEIVAVVTQPDKAVKRSSKLVYSPVKEAAIQLGLNILQPIKASDDAFIDQIEELEPEVIVVVAYGQILKKRLLDIPKYGCVNVHASLLPKYRGASPIQWAVINGDEYSGVTTMLMAEGLDTGDMLLTKEVKLDSKETGGSLFDKLSLVGAKLLVETLERIESNSIEVIPQDDSKATYVTIFKKSSGELNFNKSAKELECLIRGLNPWPSAFTKLNGKKLTIWQASPIDTDKNLDPGHVVAVGKDYFDISCGQGLLRVEEVQLEGKKRMSVKDFLNGKGIELDQKIG